MARIINTNKDSPSFIIFPIWCVLCSFKYLDEQVSHVTPSSVELHLIYEMSLFPGEMLLALGTGSILLDMLTWPSCKVTVETQQDHYKQM